MKLLPTFILLLFFCVSHAQVRRIEAAKTGNSIKIDGDTNDPAWKEIIPVTDFITSTPVYGDRPQQATFVKITYDNTAVYILAYMHTAPANVRKQLTARDDLDFQDVDVFSLGLDTYNDKQNGFLFQVTAAGVQGDARISAVVDKTWDAVWESKVSMKNDGWVAEIKIPFSAIRFSKTPFQTWGVQFTSFSRKTNETSTWSPDDPAINGTINKWGEWNGLQNILPPLRLSFLPYLSGGIRVSPVGTSKITEYLKSGGMDVKYGINESFTLDATLIPDFAQVQSDNIVLNLSPFDIKFTDYRPFFTEGTELFNKGGIFYSRRIGNEPSGAYGVLQLATASPDYTIIKNPGITRLYNATKFSGRTKNNLGIGILNSLTVPMYAEIRDNSKDSTYRVLTEPLTNYNIIVLDQALKNRSSITFTNTNVLRKGNSRNANVAALDISLYDKKNLHQFFIDGLYSNIWGNEGKYAGYKSDIRFRKVSGKFQYNINAAVISDTYDPNDLGFLRNNNQFNFGTTFSYVTFKPSTHFLNHRYDIGFINLYLYNPFKWQNFVTNSSASFLLKNFWDVTATFQMQPYWSNDYFELRTQGKFLKRAPVYYLDVNGSTDSRKKLFVNYDFGYAETPLPKDPYYSGTVGFRYRFSDKFQMNTEVHAETDNGNWGYAYRDISTGQPVVGTRKIRTNYSILGATYNFNPLMNLTVRMRHYWSRVNYSNFYDIMNNGYWTDRAYEGGHDQNFNTFNLDMFYTWNFLLGSRIILSWKNALGADVNIDGMVNRTYTKNFTTVFHNPHSNELTLKIIYYVDYLRRSR
ncbi:MAG TPA: DUF5916 domain-containing protein [Chitinophagaceae bacterium]|nr:DUF5916 domain-containing protein [Chitinophagaceae bacterium]